MPQDTNERVTLRQFCKALAFFVVFWGVVNTSMLERNT